MSALSQRLELALVALSKGNRRTLLQLVRDEPAALQAMAAQFGMEPEAVSQDLSMLHLTEYEQQYDALAGRYDPRLVEAAVLDAGSRVLDIGCGTGVSTRYAARVAVDGSVLGVDLSAALLKRAREHSRVERLDNTAFEQADAQVHPFPPGSFDVALSRFGAMYFTDPVAAFSNIGVALRPGGRLALITWQALERNEWMSAVRDAVALGRPLEPLPVGTPGAFGLADAGDVRRILAEAGFVDVRIDEACEPVRFGPDVDRAFGFVSTLAFAKDVLARLERDERSEALARLRATLAGRDTGDGVWFPSGTWITTARRP